MSSAPAIEVDVYSHVTGQLVLLMRGLSCQACGNLIVGAPLDAEGRCPGCVCAEQACAGCGVDVPALDVCTRDGQGLCLACAERHDDGDEQPHEHTPCCGGYGCAHCEATGYAG